MSNNDWYDNSGWYEPLHPEKKTVPAPFVPERQGSSHRCSAARATIRASGARQ